MTGSPTPNAPTDAWAQCKLVTPDNTTVPKYFSAFRDRVMRQLTQFKWAARPDANDVIYQMMQPAIRFSLDDCTDLPEQMFITREAELTLEQKKAYKDMLSKLATEYAGGQILAVNEAIKANKLIQIACGVAYGTGGEEVVIPSKPRMDVLKEIIEESEGKVIVFVLVVLFTYFYTAVTFDPEATSAVYDMLHTVLPLFGMTFWDSAQGYAAEIHAEQLANTEIRQRCAEHLPALLITLQRLGLGAQQQALLSSLHRYAAESAEVAAPEILAMIAQLGEQLGEE